MAGLNIKWANLCSPPNAAEPLEQSLTGCAAGVAPGKQGSPSVSSTADACRTLRGERSNSSIGTFDRSILSSEFDPVESSRLGRLLATLLARLPEAVGRGRSAFVSIGINT